ncbi:MAG: hypothetical protein KC417_15520, partial [Myxococcales bacterium]|nr:hypothetical protein [Myxococcales bacterium]
MKNLNISLVRNLVAVASLGAVLVSCGEGDVSQTDFGVRSTLDNATCGDGYVPFTYPARPIDPNTERYQSTATEDKTTVAGNMVDQTTVRLSPAVGINVNSADCGGASSSEDDAIRQACGGEKDCTYTATCSGAFKVSYGCGPGDVDSAGSQNVYTATIAANATKRDVSLSCKEVASVGTEAAPKSACIPQNCVGKARRDALLNCVPDKTMQTVYDTDIDVDGKRPGFISEVVSSSSPKSLGGSGDPIVTLTPEVPYRFDLRFRYKGEIPDNAKVTFWLADQWIPRSRQYDDEVRWDDKDSVYAYRCAALTVDVSKRNADADGWVSISQEEILANDCFRSRPVKGSSFDYISFALARKGFDSNQAVRVTTRVFHSFDVEGNTQYVERVGKTSVDETAVCQPNPLELFFDSRFDFYDYEGYYRQRQIDKVLGVVPQGVAVDIFPKGVTIGPKEMKLNVAQVTVTQHPIRSPSLPIDINWYVANLNQWTSFSPDYYGWGEKFPNDNRWTTGYGTAALPDLHANVYLWPRDATKVARIPVLAKVPLNIKESNANGSTVSVDVKMPTNTRRQFFNPSSPLYIPKDPGWRQYDVFYCIESGVPEKTVETRFFYPNAKLKYEVIDKPYWLRVGSGHLKAPAGSVYNEPGVYNPWNDSVGPGQGCRFAKEPLIVYADRFERPLTPASDSSFTGLPNEKGAGSSTMAATTDADSEMTCVGTNERECQEVTKNAMGSSGQMGRSFFSVHNGLDRDEGQDASVDGSAEALGFQVIDPSDPEEDDVSWGSSSTPVTMSITPPWDAIWSALKKLAARSPIKWAKGFFAALEGIGVGWGIEVPVQIGPIPGLITITFSVGVSLDLHAELQFAPEEGKDYPCIG